MINIPYIGYFITPVLWWKHRRVIINARLWNYHLQILVWNKPFRLIKSQSGNNCFRLDEFLLWRLPLPEEFIAEHKEYRAYVNNKKLKGNV